MKKTILILLVILISQVSYAQQTVGLFINDSLAYNGYTLIAPFNSNQTYLIDNCGEIVHQWQNSNYWPGASTYLLEDGRLLRTARRTDGHFNTGGIGGTIEIYDWNDNLIWSYDVLDSTQQQHHDVEMLPNGNILILSFDYISKADAIAAGKDTTLIDEDGLWSEKIIEVQPNGLNNGTIVWEWYLWDHIIQDFDSSLPNYGMVSQHPELIDINYYVPYNVIELAHANSIAYNKDLDQIIISSRDYSEIWIIDHSTTTQEAAGNTGGIYGKGGDLLFRWGNTDAYKLGNPNGRTFYGQHDAHWIPDSLPQGGMIMVYNNGLDFQGEYSQVQIIDPQFINEEYQYDSTFGYLPNSPEWSYITPHFSDFISGANRLPNGNTLICDGGDGIITEINDQDSIVWRYVNPAGLNGFVASQGNPPGNSSLFRAYKYGVNYPAFQGKNLIPQGPIENNPWPSTCLIYTKTQQQEVFLDVKVAPNPIGDELRFINATTQEIQIAVYDLLGNLILQDNISDSHKSYDSSNWQAGVYIVTIMDTKSQARFSQKVIKF